MGKNTLQYILTSILSIFLVGLCIWALWFLKEADDQIAVFGIIAVILAAITSVLTVSISNNKARQREYDLLILKEKQEVFDHFYETLFEISNSTLKGKNTLTNKTMSEMMFFKRGLMNWGSEHLIGKYLEYEEKISAQGSNQQKLKDADEFLREIRKELGFEDSKKLSLMSILLKPEARKELNM